VLVYVTVEDGGADTACLSDLVFSDGSGEALDASLVNCTTIAVDEFTEPVFGCTESGACNYDEYATDDDDSCWFAEENYDCDGTCTAEFDCAGECGGDAVVDECGDCNGDGPGMCWDGSEECDLSDCPPTPTDTFAVGFN
jgi:hypothetical protein